MKSWEDSILESWEKKNFLGVVSQRFNFSDDAFILSSCAGGKGPWSRTKCGTSTRTQTPAKLLIMGNVGESAFFFRANFFHILKTPATTGDGKDP